MDFIIIYVCLILVMGFIGGVLLKTSIIQTICHMVDVDTIAQYILASCLFSETIICIIKIIMLVIK